MNPKLPPVTFAQICPSYARRFRKGLSYYSRRQIRDDFQYCVVGEGRGHIDYDILEIQPNKFFRLFGVKTKKNPIGCAECRDLAIEFGHRAKKKEPMADLIEKFTAHYNEKHLEEYYAKHPLPADFKQPESVEMEVEVKHED